MDDLADIFSALYQEHQAGLLRYGWHLGDGDDLTGEMWLRVWKGRETMRPDQDLGHWLMRSLHNAAIDARRQRARRVVEVPLLESDLSAAASTDEAPEAAVERADRAVTVHALLRQLPPLQAVALWLCDGQGMVHTEAAALLGWPLGTVKTRLMLGRRKFVALWAAEEARAA